MALRSQASTLRTRAPSTASDLRRVAVDRLQRLYASQGKTGRVLELELARLEADPALGERDDAFEASAARFGAAGEEECLLAWARDRLARDQRPAARANLCWLVQDLPCAIGALALRAAEGGATAGPELARWKERFRKAGNEPYVALLLALVAGDPADGESRLELLETKGIRTGPEVVDALELLLATRETPPRRGATGSPRFRNRYEIAYRLMRLYERVPGMEGRILALGFRILRREEPFAWPAGALASHRAGWTAGPNDDGSVPDLLRALQVFLAHLRRKDDLAAAALEIEKSGSIPLRNQIRLLQRGRLRQRVEPVTGHEIAHSSVRVRTSGVPEGARLLTDRDDVRAIAPGARWGGGGGRSDLVWIGTSWGLVRYRQTKGSALEVLQVPLGVGHAAPGEPSRRGGRRSRRHRPDVPQLHPRPRDRGGPRGGRGASRPRPSGAVGRTVAAPRRLRPSPRRGGPLPLPERDARPPRDAGRAA